MTLIAQGVTGAVSEHVRPHPTESRSLTRFADQVVHGLARHWLLRAPRRPSLAASSSRSISGGSR